MAKQQRCEIHATLTVSAQYLGEHYTAQYVGEQQQRETHATLTVSAQFV